MTCFLDKFVKHILPELNHAVYSIKKNLLNFIKNQEECLVPMNEIVLNVLLSLFFTFLGVVLALWYENLGSPRFKVEPIEPTDEDRPNKKRVKFLHLTVRNTPRKLPFVTRQTAYDCHVEVEIFETVGKVLLASFPVRWNNKPEPIKQEIVDNEIVQLYDARLDREGRYIDIPPDEEESFALLLRIFGDFDAYGWNNENYGFEYWQHPKRKFMSGEYVVRVTIKTGDFNGDWEFKFANHENYDDFRLLSV